MSLKNIFRGCLAFVLSQAVILSALAMTPVINEFQQIVPVDGQQVNSVDIDGHRMVVGNANDLVNGLPRGSVTVYTFNGTSWDKEAKLTPANGMMTRGFGSTALILGDRIVVSDPSTLFTEMAGAVYIYEFDGSAWLQTAVLPSSDIAGVGNGFANKIAISNDRIVIGAQTDSQNGFESGAAYVYAFDGLNWFLEQKLLASDGAEGDQFGSSLAIDGNRIVVYGDKGVNGGGAVYVFSRTGSTWIEEKKLVPSVAVGGFGAGVAITGNRIVVGSPVSINAEVSSGLVYVYAFNGADWVEEQQLSASDAADFDYFGFSVAMSGNRILVGSLFDDDSGADSGSAYVYVLSGSTWVETAKLTVSENDDFRYLGAPATISGDLIVLGAAAQSDTIYAYQLASLLPPPKELIVDLFDATKMCIISGELRGKGWSRFPYAFAAHLYVIKYAIEKERYRSACLIIDRLIQRTDGLAPPISKRDIVRGQCLQAGNDPDLVKLLMDLKLSIDSGPGCN